MNEMTAKKGVKTADPHLAVGKKRAQPKSPSPPAESHSRVREEQSATALAAAVLPTPFCLSSPSDAIPSGGTTYPLWGGPIRWSSSMALGPPLGWDHHDALATMTNMSFATHDITQNGDSNAVSAPNRELGFPVTINSMAAMDDRGIYSMGATEDSLPNKSLERWQVLDSNTIPLPAASFANLLHYPSLPYTDAHAYTHTRPYATESIGLFNPGSDVAELHHGFTGTGDGVTTSTSFRDALVGLPGASAFPHEKPRVLGDAPMETINRFPVTHCHAGHVPDVNRYLGPDGFHLPSNNGPWYETEISAPSFDPTVAQPSPRCRSLLVGESRWNSDLKQAVTGLGRPLPSACKVAQGEVKTPRRRRPRGQLLPKEREETSNTRKRKACIRCRMQKIRVSHSIS